MTSQDKVAVILAQEAGMPIEARPAKIKLGHKIQEENMKKKTIRVGDFNVGVKGSRMVITKKRLRGIKECMDALRVLERHGEDHNFVMGYINGHSVGVSSGGGNIGCTEFTYAQLLKVERMLNASN